MARKIVKDFICDDEFEKSIKLKDATVSVTYHWNRPSVRTTIARQDVLDVTLPFSVSGAVLEMVDEDTFVKFFSEQLAEKIREIYKSTRVTE